MSTKKNTKKQDEGQTKPNTMRAVIMTALKKTGKMPMPFKTILNRCRSCKDFTFEEYVKLIDKMKSEGKIFEDNMGFTLANKKNFVKCRIVRLSKTFGFARNIETNEDIFIPGKFLKGAMPEDIVLVSAKKSDRQSLEGEVISVVEENFSCFSGEIVDEFGQLKIVPDTLSKYAMEFSNPNCIELEVGDKVTAMITKRGEKHSEHKCQLTASYGSSLNASACALAVLSVNGISPIFPAEVIADARTVSDYRMIEDEIPNRRDLRGMPIFTIDGADTKDIDDAVSVEREETGYLLGVHIADVSHYVRPKSPLDNEAFGRGTSVYYANRVVPMLPKELSNGICSLNPQEDRLAFSCLCHLDKNGKIISYEFAKTVIRSRVKGVYSEINDILSGNISKDMKAKYNEVMPCFDIISELADILSKNKKSRGTPELETGECKLIIDENDKCVDVVVRSRGRTEEIIEDFMLVANECAAKFGTDNELPFVYRIHEEPTIEKIEAFKEGLTTLGIMFNFGDKISPKNMSEVLEQVKGTTSAPIVNNLVLRSMMKAQYSTEPVGHFGLCLKDYAHFTSPIRRYPDLSIHRIMSDFLNGSTAEEINSRYNKFAYASADQSTKTELTAMTVERDCEDCYKAEYMSSKIGEEFDGVISGVMDFGIFVALENTCEGLCRTDEMPAGVYTLNGAVSLRNENTGVIYRVGDAVRIKVLSANVNSGKVDFTLIPA